MRFTVSHVQGQSNYHLSAHVITLLAQFFGSLSFKKILNAAECISGRELIVGMQYNRFSAAADVSRGVAMIEKTGNVEIRDKEMV